MKCPLIELNDGFKIPQIGLGAYQLTDEIQCINSCLEAFKSGYRHIDTAHRYGNEKYVGEAVLKSGLKREEIYITSKVWPTEFGEGLTEKQVEKMLRRINLEYIDLILLHWPFGDYIGAWKDLEKCVKKGYVKSIGLSNFEGKSLNDILDICTIKPALNQLECHPFRNRFDIKKILDEHNIKIECWYPIGHGDEGLINNSVIQSLAEKYKKTCVQIILRWHIQVGYIPIPKSSNPIHIKENFNIFDFKLTDEEMNQINALPQKNIWVPKVGTIEAFSKAAMEFKFED